MPAGDAEKRRSKAGKCRRNPAKTIDYCGFCRLIAKMPSRPENRRNHSTMPRFWTALAVFAITAASALSPVRADDLQDISKLLRGGQHTQALERVNRYL